MTGAPMLTLAAVLLAQAQPTPALALAGLYGRTLGAAAECTGVARDRIAAAAEKASAHLKAVAQDPAAQAAAGGELTRAVERGNRDVTSGAVTCAQAESELGNLEHDLAASR
jgi:tetrahydromethanopterin S-methyltransferase subunit E